MASLLERQELFEATDQVDRAYRRVAAALLTYDADRTCDALEDLARRADYLQGVVRRVLR